MRRAFTIIELLVALCIILILASLVVYGVRSIHEATKEADSTSAVQVARAAVDKYKLMGQRNTRGLEWVVGGVYGDHAAGAAMPFLSSFRIDGTGKGWPMFLSSEVIPDDFQQWNTELAQNTFLAYEFFNRVTPKSFKEDAPIWTMTIGGTSRRARVILDGYRRPLVFCPGAGMSLVQNPADGSAVTMCDGTIRNYIDSKQPIPNDWPYQSLNFGFFSAGADGNPSTFTDNVWH